MAADHSSSPTPVLVVASAPNPLLSSSTDSSSMYTYYVPIYHTNIQLLDITILNPLKTHPPGPLPPQPSKTLVLNPPSPPRQLRPQPYATTKTSKAGLQCGFPPLGPVCLGGRRDADHFVSQQNPWAPPPRGSFLARIGMGCLGLGWSETKACGMTYIAACQNVRFRLHVAWGRRFGGGDGVFACVIAIYEVLA